MPEAEITRAPISPEAVLLLLGLSFFLGLAIEDIYERRGRDRPGGVRTFPLLSLSGAGLYAIEPRYALAFIAGLLVLGAWLHVYYRARVEQAVERARDEVRGGAADASQSERPGLGITVPVANLVAYLLGPVVLLTPSWFPVAITVSAVLLLSARDVLHDLARRIPLAEITTLGKFLILTGIVLPLLPNEPVVSWTRITPHQVWLAVVAVATLSYGSYLLQLLTPAGRGILWSSVLGGLYSSTATTVVLARRARETADGELVQAGIVLATALMYLRLVAVIALFDSQLALAAAPWLSALALFAALLARVVAWKGLRAASGPARAAVAPPANPLELSAALIFALLFVAVSLGTGWVRDHFGQWGIYAFAALIGVTDIDPFVLSLAQGGLHDSPRSVLVVAIVVAASSNDLLKAAYAGAFGGWRRSAPSMTALVAIALAGFAAALRIAQG